MCFARSLPGSAPQPISPRDGIQQHLSATQSSAVCGAFPTDGCKTSDLLPTPLRPTVGLPPVAEYAGSTDKEGVSNGAATREGRQHPAQWGSPFKFRVTWTRKKTKSKAKDCKMKLHENVKWSPSVIIES